MIAAIEAPAAAPAREYPLAFTGTAAEYFRIWIVNLALTVLTVGIYSAWAKVRKKRYFYGHTIVDGEGFDYRANPVAILKGRLIAVAVFAGFYFATRIDFRLAVAAFAIGLLVMPWLIVRSFAFNAFNSAYRNVSFHFHGRYRTAMRIFLLYGLVVVFTFGLGYPYLKVKMTEFVVRNHYYGKTQFGIEPLKKVFFSIYSGAIGIGILFAIASGVAGFAVASSLDGPVAEDSPIALAFNIVGYVFYLFIFAFLRARIANATLGMLEVGSLRFRCNLRVARLYGIYLVNVVAILATAGLATPWAVIRTLRYRAESVTVIAPEGLEAFVAWESAQVGAAGEEIGEMFDVDLGL
jgi:uncharacterized membrane protein YjgN (DUF898 family)